MDSLGIGVFSKLDVTHPKVVDLENDESDEYQVAHNKETKPCRIEVILKPSYANSRITINNEK